MRRLLLRIGFFRYCLLQNRLRERKKRSDVRWQYRQSVLSTLGLIAVTWAGIEMMIDHLIAWYHPSIGQHSIQKEQPVNFIRKMAYINKMKRDPRFNDEAVNALDYLMKEAKRLNKARKLIIHGVAFHRNGFSSTWHFSIREFDGVDSVQKLYPVKDSDLLEILRQMSALSSSTASWVWKLTHSTDEAIAMHSSAKSA